MTTSTAQGGDPKPSDLRPRVVSAIFLIVITVLVTWAGGVLFAIAMCALGSVLYYEWTRMTLLPTQAFSVIWGAATLAISSVAIIIGAVPFAIWFAAGAAAALVAGVYLRLFATATLTRAKWAVTGLAYALSAAVSLVVIRYAGGADAATDGFLNDRGVVLLAFLFLTVWATDILAYFVGRAVGGPKLMPSVSPKKTISGALGGLAAAALVGLAFAASSHGFGTFGTIALACVLSVVSQIGDLFESWIKRRYAVKDSSQLIPGHGGFMDRVDGLVFAAVPLAIYVAATT